MLLDFLFELLSDFSPVYLYVSVLISAFYVIKWLPQFDLFLNKEYDLRDYHRLKGRFLRVEDNINEIIDRRNWLAIITKRTEVPDDDEEGAHPSTVRLEIKRGGAQCEVNLYSLYSRKPALLGASY